MIASVNFPNRSYPAPTIDRKKLYKNFLCGICEKIIKKAAILRMCSCRFCHSCILGVYQSGEKTCPHPRCSMKPRPPLRNSATDVLLNPPFDQLVIMCGFQAHQVKEDFLDSASLAKLASQNVQKVESNRKRPYETPPDFTSPRKTSLKLFTNQNQKIQQPKDSFDLENSLLKAFMSFSNSSCSELKIQSSFAKSRWILAKRRLREDQNGATSSSFVRKRRLGDVASDSDQSEIDSNASGFSFQRNTKENEDDDQEESEISDSSESEAEFENEKRENEENLETPQPSTSTEMIPTEDERLEQAAKEIYLAEQQRIRDLAQLDDPKHPLILWPDMRLEVKEIRRRQLHAHYLFVPDSCTMETLSKFVLMKLFQEEEIDLNQEDLTVAFVPVVEEVEATNIVILKRESRQDPNNSEKPKDHAVTLKIENPQHACVLIFDYPSLMVTKKSTMAQVRGELWKDRTKPMKLIYQVKLKSAEKSATTSTETPLHTPITADPPPMATTPTSSTNTSTPSDPTPTTPKDFQPTISLPPLPKPIQIDRSMAIPHGLPTTAVPFVPPPMLPSGILRPFPPFTSPLPTAPPILQIRPNIPFLAASNMANPSLSSQQQMGMPQPIPVQTPNPPDPRADFGGVDSRNSSGGDSDGMPTLDPEV